MTLWDNSTNKKAVLSLGVSAGVMVGIAMAILAALSLAIGTGLFSRS